MITRDTFDKTLNSLGTGKVPAPDGIPNEIIKLLPPATRLTLFSLLSLFAYTSTAQHACYIRKVTTPSSTTTAPLPS
jgi:hypothetical protein